MRIPSLTNRGERSPVTDETPTKPITTTTEKERVETRPAAPRVRRPRASLFATLTLVSGVAAALVVLTGVLAAYGIALGGLTVLLAIGGISATSKPHVAGKSDATIGLALGLAAIVVGVLAVTDQLSWLTTSSDRVGELRDWLDAQTVDRF